MQKRKPGNIGLEASAPGGRMRMSFCATPTDKMAVGNWRRSRSPNCLPPSKTIKLKKTEGENDANYKIKQ
jgi:hypothetical protein